MKNTNFSVFKRGQGGQSTPALGVWKVGGHAPMLPSAYFLRVPHVSWWCHCCTNGHNFFDKKSPNFFWQTTSPQCVMLHHSYRHCWQYLSPHDSKPSVTLTPWWLKAYWRKSSHIIKEICFAQHPHHCTRWGPWNHSSLVRLWHRCCGVMAQQSHTRHGLR